jgi:hypothetical protein
LVMALALRLPWKLYNIVSKVALSECRFAISHCATTW